jgi:hypothetical protein
MAPTVALELNDGYDSLRGKLADIVDEDLVTADKFTDLLRKAGSDGDIDQKEAEELVKLLEPGADDPTTRKPGDEERRKKAAKLIDGYKLDNLYVEFQDNLRTLIENPKALEILMAGGEPSMYGRKGDIRYDGVEWLAGLDLNAPDEAWNGITDIDERKALKNAAQLLTGDGKKGQAWLFREALAERGDPGTLTVEEARSVVEPHRERREVFGKDFADEAPEIRAGKLYQILSEYHSGGDRSLLPELFTTLGLDGQIDPDKLVEAIFGKRGKRLAREDSARNFQNFVTRLHGYAYENVTSQTRDNYGGFMSDHGIMGYRTDEKGDYAPAADVLIDFLKIDTKVPPPPIEYGPSHEVPDPNDDNIGEWDGFTHILDEDGNMVPAVFNEHGELVPYTGPT